jgi:polyferredoxin
VRVAVRVLVVLLFVAALLYATFNEASVRCDVCLDFAGESACRSGSGVDREAAVRSAVASACAVLARGVTQSLACDAAPPRAVDCR